MSLLLEHHGRRFAAVHSAPPCFASVQLSGMIPPFNICSKTEHIWADSVGYPNFQNLVDEDVAVHCHTK